MSVNDKRDFPTYGGLSRAAVVNGLGIPLMPVIYVTVGSLIFVTFLQIFMGLWAFLFLIVSVLVLVLIKAICATDDQAMRILSFEIQWFFKKTNRAIWGNNLVLLPIKYGRCENEIKRFYE